MLNDDIRPGEFTSLELHLLRALMLTVTFVSYGVKKGYPVLDNHNGELFADIKRFSQRVSNDVVTMLGRDIWLGYVGDSLDHPTLRYMPDGSYLEHELWGKRETDNQDTGNGN